MTRNHVKVTIRDGRGRVVAKVTARIPKRFRRNELDDWHGLTDAWADGLAAGIARSTDIARLRRKP